MRIGREENVARAGEVARRISNPPPAAMVTLENEKLFGDSCVKKGDFKQAVVHYSNVLEQQGAFPGRSASRRAARAVLAHAVSLTAASAGGWLSR